MKREIIGAVLIIAFALIAAAIFKAGHFDRFFRQRVIGCPVQVNITMIDCNNPSNMETLSFTKWGQRGRNEKGYYQSSTGEYVMITPMKCPKCGKDIPSLPPLALHAGEDEDKGREVYFQARRQYKCPFCAQFVFEK